MGNSVEMLLPKGMRKLHEIYREGYFNNPSPRPMGAGRDLQGRRKNGTQFPVEIGLSYTATQEGKLALAFITDITDREQMEQVLREQQEFQSQVLQTLDDMGEGLLISQEGKFVYTNDAFVTLTGYSLGDLGEMASVVHLVIPQQLQNLHDHI